MEFGMGWTIMVFCKRRILNRESSAKSLTKTPKKQHSISKERSISPTEVVSLRFVHKPTQTAKFKVGLFIYACFSYLCRQAVLQ